MKQDNFMKVKAWYTSKEIWVAIFGVVNYFLNWLGWPSFEPTAEFYGALVIVMGAIRAYWTDSKLGWSARSHT